MTTTASKPLARLRLLGPVAARDRRGRPANVGEKPLALLAYLHVAPPAGLKDRDTVAGMFWPDFDTGRARRGLRQSIAALRFVFGRGVVVSHGKHHLELPAGGVVSDVMELRAARAAGRLEEAADHYQGAFMEGARLLNVSEDVHEWVFRQRLLLETEATGLLVELAQRAAVAGKGEVALNWARRALWLTGGKETTLRGLLRGCCEGGQFGVAAELYSEYVGWLHRQADLDPSPATRAVVAELLERV